MIKVTSKKLEKSLRNFQTHFRNSEIKSINGKYSLFFKDKEILKDYTIREFYLTLEALRAFFLIWKPELIENFLNDLKKMEGKYK